MKRKKNEKLSEILKKVEYCEAIRKSIKVELARCLAVIEKLANKESVKQDQAV